MFCDDVGISGTGGKDCTVLLLPGKSRYKLCSGREKAKRGYNDAGRGRRVLELRLAARVAHKNR